MSVITGILLAAGAATRFGGNKLLHPMASGRSIAESAALHLCAALPGSIAVIRPTDDVLADLFGAGGMRIVRCPSAARGMGFSLACGVAAAAESDAWVIALADMPVIAPATIRRIVDRLRAGDDIVAPYFAGQRGHPVGFGRRFRSELLAMHRDAGARAIIERHDASLHRLAVNDPGVVRDIDTRADLDGVLAVPGPAR